MFRCNATVQSTAGSSAGDLITSSCEDVHHALQQPRTLQHYDSGLRGSRVLHGCTLWTFPQDAMYETWATDPDDWDSREYGNDDLIEALYMVCSETETPAASQPTQTLQIHCKFVWRLVTPRPVTQMYCHTYAPFPLLLPINAALRELNVGFV